MFGSDLALGVEFSLILGIFENLRQPLYLQTWAPFAAFWCGRVNVSQL